MATTRTTFLSGWAQFIGWGFGGAVLIASLIDGAAGGPGVFVVPVGLVVVIALGRKGGPVWPDVLGVVLGLGGLCLAVAYFNRHIQTCTSGACPGLNPRPWLVIGAVLALGSVVSYAWLRRDRQTNRELSG